MFTSAPRVLFCACSTFYVGVAVDTAALVVDAAADAVLQATTLYLLCFVPRALSCAWSTFMCRSCCPSLAVARAVEYLLVVIVVVVVTAALLAPIFAVLVSASASRARSWGRRCTSRIWRGGYFWESIGICVMVISIGPPPIWRWKWGVVKKIYRI